MKSKLLTTSAMGLLLASKLSTGAHADSTNFEGPFISLGAETITTDVDVKENASNIPTAAAYTQVASASAVSNFVGFNASATTIIGRAVNTLTSDDSNEQGVVEAGNFFAIDDKFLIGLSARATTGGKAITKDGTYTLSTITYGTTSATIANTSGTTKHEITDKSSYGIELSPAYALNDKAMVYGSLGYSITTKEAQTIYDGTTIRKTVEDDVDGYTAGVGLRYNIENNFFVDVNARYTKYDDLVVSNSDSGQSVTTGSAATITNSTTNTLSNTFESEAYSLGIKVGYKF